MTNEAEYTRPGRIPERRQQGLYAEELALDWFQMQGYRLLKRNLRRPRIGEVDLVLYKDRLIHAVEVKSLGAACRDRRLDPVCYATPAQLRRVMRVLELWLLNRSTLALLPEWEGISIDIFTVDHRQRPPRLRHIPGVQAPEEGLAGF